jgi:hypothetical protein
VSPVESAGWLVPTRWSVCCSIRIDASRPLRCDHRSTTQRRTRTPPGRGAVIVSAGGPKANQLIVELSGTPPSIGAIEDARDCAERDACARVIDGHGGPVEEFHVWSWCAWLELNQRPSD